MTANVTAVASLTDTNLTGAGPPGAMAANMTSRTRPPAAGPGVVS